jgi:hypothetical protein
MGGKVAHAVHLPPILFLDLGSGQMAGSPPEAAQRPPNPQRVDNSADLKYHEKARVEGLLRLVMFPRGWASDKVWEAIPMPAIVQRR